jgi:ATP/maltotriose-dependent transcriptional regulator MalT
VFLDAQRDDKSIQSEFRARIPYRDRVGPSGPRRKACVAECESNTGVPGSRQGGGECVYVRAQAFLAANQGAAAAAEFQKILDHRGVVGPCETGAVAHLGLARAYALQGDTAKARAAYNDFLTLWKNADPDIPILIAAKSEYAKLE